MWLSQRTGRGKYINRSTDVGDITIADAQTGVMLDGELRDLGLMTPGGYVWRPKKGQDVIVIKSADGENFAAGIPLDSAQGVVPGEVLILSDGGCQIMLKNDGSILLSGRVNINGELYINGTLCSCC